MPKIKHSKTAETEQMLHLSSEAVFEQFSGVRHENFKKISELLDVKIGGRGLSIHIIGQKDKVETAKRLFSQLDRFQKKGRSLTSKDIVMAAEFLKEDPQADLHSFFSETIFRPRVGPQVVPKSPGQRELIQAIRDHDLVFGVGPAGTGKTFLAVVMAVGELLAKRVSRIVLTRPAVEAGERLGFLPGSMEEKVLPYLRPLYDALFEMLGPEQVDEWIASNVIEIAPLAFMRGRTLNDSFVILDEAQNTTREQMKMFVTRLGFGSKMVVVGDLTQIDLQANVYPGLLESIEILGHVKGIAVCKLSDKDVVRHPLVQGIIRAYEETHDSRSAHRRT